MRNILRDAIYGIELDHDAWSRTWAWAGQLAAYDAAYASLAEAKQATLVTYDLVLTQTVRERVPVIGRDGLD